METCNAPVILKMNCTWARYENVAISQIYVHSGFYMNKGLNLYLRFMTFRLNYIIITLVEIKNYGFALEFEYKTYFYTLFYVNTIIIQETKLHFKNEKIYLGPHQKQNVLFKMALICKIPLFTPRKFKPAVFWTA